MSDAFDPCYGTAVELEAGLRRITAPNPSPMTQHGTNTYLVGHTDIAVIDPGPHHEAHLAAILEALSPSQEITKIIVTHSHLDHSPLAAPLAQATGAPVLAFGDATAGRSDIMSRLAAEGLTGGGEGIDTAFRPDRCVTDGERIEGQGWSLKVLHTPGHLGNHICLAWDDICFTADHVMGWASSLVSPPDGDLTDFMASCGRLKKRAWRVFYPGHGAKITAPAARLDWLISHRLSREESILCALRDGPGTAASLTKRIYTDTPARLLPAAQRNVTAHLIDLFGKSLIRTDGQLTSESTFRVAD